MLRSLIALAGAAVLVVAILAGSFMMNGGIPGVHAMGLTDAFSLMHSGTHGHMHGDGECPYHDQKPGGMMHRGMGNNQTRSAVDCPHDNGTMHRGIHGNSAHHNHPMMGNSGNCPFASRN
jgi:hypothetical protein